MANEVGHWHGGYRDSEQEKSPVPRESRGNGKWLSKKSKNLKHTHVRRKLCSGSTRLGGRSHMGRVERTTPVLDGHGAFGEGTRREKKKAESDTCLQVVGKGR
jgi:hypothetical protein